MANCWRLVFGVGKTRGLAVSQADCTSITCHRRHYTTASGQGQEICQINKDFSRVSGTVDSGKGATVLASNPQSRGRVRPRLLPRCGHLARSELKAEW